MSLTLICYCHLVSKAEIVRGSTGHLTFTTMKHRYLLIWLTYCTHLNGIASCYCCGVLAQSSNAQIKIMLFTLYLLTQLLLFASCSFGCKKVPSLDEKGVVTLLVVCVHSLLLSIFRGGYVLQLLWQFVFFGARLSRVSEYISSIKEYSNRTGHLQNGSLAGVAHLL